MEVREQFAQSLIEKLQQRNLGTFLNTDRGFRWMVGVLGVSGILLGYRLSCVPALHPYKLLNLTGLILTFLGVLVLSERVASPLWKAFCVNCIAPAVLWVLTVLPIGVLIGSIAAGFVHKPSPRAVGLFSLEIWGYSGLVMRMFHSLVVRPRRDVETRWGWMGFFLVLGGVVSQLVAAILDLGQ
jgi:hypothetical protein